MSKDCAVAVIRGRVSLTTDEATRKRIVSESYSSGMSLNSFAREKGISPASLCAWRKKYPASPPMRENDDELESLRAENAALKRELFQMKAYLGHKLYQLEAPKFA